MEICVQDPGKDVDVFFTTDLRTMIGVWMGDLTYRSVMGDGRLETGGTPRPDPQRQQLDGEQHLRRDSARQPDLTTGDAGYRRLWIRKTAQVGLGAHHRQDQSFSPKP
ncbi:MAG: hypothetical protein U9R74_08300 [Pseudomonadota bacterium]|nr:hypothetical protein [Pseudomonadota bacterium]